MTCRATWASTSIGEETTRAELRGESRPWSLWGFYREGKAGQEEPFRPG